MQLLTGGACPGLRGRTGDEVGAGKEATAAAGEGKHSPGGHLERDWWSPASGRGPGSTGAKEGEGAVWRATGRGGGA